MGTTLYYGPFRRLLPSHIVDSGQLAHNWTSSATPVKVYIGDTIGSYAGTSVPVDGGAVTRCLIGNGGSGSWPANLPPIQNNSNGDYYDSHAYASSIPGHMSCGWSYAPTAYNPSLYTGLMRLAMQAKLGAAKNPDDFVTTTPSNCNPVIDAESHGIIHDEDYYFWQIKISSGGAIATKLKNTAATEWCRANLASGAVTDDKFLVYLLADLTIDETETPVTMLTSSSFTNAYGGREPVAHGWHYTRQAPWLSCLSTHREYVDGSDWAIEATLAEATLSFSSGVPQASINMAQQDQVLFLRPLQPGWIPTGAGAYKAYAFSVGQTPPAGHTDGGVYYAFYDADGARVDLEWDYNGSETVSETDRQNTDICGFGTHETEYHDSFLAYLGGWTVGGVAPSERVRFSSKVEESITWDVAQWAGDIPSEQSNPSHLPIATNCETGETLGDAAAEVVDCYSEYPDGSITLKNAGCTRVWNTHTVNNLSYNQFIIIPITDAEAVYTGQYIANQYDGSIVDTQWAAKKWETIVHYRSVRVGTGRLCVWNPTHEFKQYTLEYTGKLSYFTSNPISIFGDLQYTTTTPDAYEDEVVTVKVVTPNGNHSCSATTLDEWWDAWIASDEQHFGLTTNFSYVGEGYYSNESADDEDVESVGGYPDMYGEHIDLPIYRLFIGWA